VAGDVVHAKQASAPVERRDCGTDRARIAADAPIRVAEQTGERALARHPDEHGWPDRADPVEPSEEREVLVNGLAEPDPGIEADAIFGDTLCDGDREGCLEECGDLADDILVRRLLLHRPRLALHVHQADVCARVRDHARHLRVGPQRGDVVHE
jgi:hypothetical protein